MKDFDNVIIFYHLRKFGVNIQSGKMHYTTLTVGSSQINLY